MRLGGAALALTVAACAGGNLEPAAPAPAAGSDAAPTPSPDDQVAVAVEQAINALGPAAHRCWQKAAADDFRLAGGVTLAVTVGPGGATAEVAVVVDQPGDPVLAACLVQAWHQATWPAALAAGDVVQVPLTFVAPEAQYVVATADVPVIEFGTGSSAQVLLDASATGNPAASMALYRHPPGLDNGLVRLPAAEVFYVLGGAATLVDLGVGPRRALRVGDAVYVPPGVAAGLVVGSAHDGVEAAGFEALVVFAPAGLEQRARGREVAGVIRLAPAEARRRSRRAAVPTVRSTAAVPPLPLGGGKGEIRILFDQAAAGDGALSLATLTAGPGMEVPRHRHAGSSEYLYVLGGRGVLHVAGIEREIGAGDAIQIPAGVEHGLVVGPDASLKALQLYTPSGPEQRFRAVAAPAAPAVPAAPAAPAAPVTR